MSRSKFPPTPAMSGEFIIKEQPCDATDLFALPPAALSPAKVEAASRRSSRSDPSFIPVSPTSPDLTARNDYPSRASTAPKRPLEDFDLPPPPTRTRKIIQMKPKAPGKSSKDTGKASPQPSPDSPTNASPASKKNPPTATSAAGRKIARKTAHSLIERRRRSKMNEEFGTLKDMIPACQGQEMHKLAILQASIDYVNYLEQCVHDLKTAGTTRTSAAPPSPTSPEFNASGPVESVQQSTRESPSSASYYSSASPELPPQATQFPDTSPSFSPRTLVPSAHALTDPPSVLPSPALGPTLSAGENTQPLQGVDHEASAALLMLTQDRRGTADSINEHFSGSTTLAALSGETKEGPGSNKRRCMSVRDLLIS